MDGEYVFTNVVMLGIRLFFGLITLVCGLLVLDLSDRIVFRKLRIERLIRERNYPGVIFYCALLAYAAIVLAVAVLR